MADVVFAVTVGGLEQKLPFDSIRFEKISQAEVEPLYSLQAKTAPPLPFDTKDVSALSLFASVFILTPLVAHCGSPFEFIFCA